MKSIFGLAQRYLASCFIPPFLVSTLFFVIFLLTFQLFRITKIIINKGVEMSTTFELVGHIAISFFPMAIPLSILFATIYTMNKLSEDSEIIAMRSFGMTKGKLFLPFLILGLALAASLFSLGQNLIPYSKTQFKNTIIKLTSKGMLSDIKAENFFTDIPNVTLFAEKVWQGGAKLENVFIHFKSTHEEKVIFAKNGALIKKSPDQWDLPSLRLHLIDGNITKTFRATSDVEKIIFQEYDFPILMDNYNPGFVSKDSMLNNKQLLKDLKKEEDRLAFLKAQPSLSDTDQHEVNDLEKSIPRTKLEFWSRINTPFQCLVFILLGFTLGIKKGRGKGRNTGVIVMIILVSYYSIFFFGVSLARKGVLPSSLAVLSPTLLACLIGGYFYYKLDWSS